MVSEDELERDRLRAPYVLRLFPDLHQWYETDEVVRVSTYVRCPICGLLAIYHPIIDARDTDMTIPHRLCTGEFVHL
jgi:hypothetical protein